MLNNEFPPLGGGTGTVNLEILKAIAAQRSAEVDLVTSTPGQTEEVEQFAEQVTLYKVPVSSRCIHHASNRELVSYASKGYRKAAELVARKRHEVCLAWSGVPAGAVAWMLRRKFNLRYLVRVCGPDIPGFEQRYRLLYPFLSPIIRRIWNESEFVIAKCAEEAALIRQASPNQRIDLVPNGVDTQRFAPLAKSNARSVVRILCVGRLIARKGHSLLLSAVKLVRDSGLPVTLDLVGTGDDESRLRSLVQAIGIQDIVTFHGYVPREKMPSVYQLADIFVLLSENEGMSVALMEAISSGLPVVVTRTASSPEIVVPGQNGLVVADAAADQVADALSTIAQDINLQVKMGQRSREIAVRYSWASTTDKLLSMIAAVTSMSTAR